MPWPPEEPPPSPWDFDLEEVEPGEDLVGVGGDLAPGTLLAAYRSGVFPMGLGEEGARPMGWWSPDPRGVLLPGGVSVSRSLKRSCRHFEIRVDTAFEEVVQRCASPHREGRWITSEVESAYIGLHRLGWAHSVETWQDGELVGGLYGVSVGGLFAGESMFHAATDASKVALVALIERLRAGGFVLLDTQWTTAHLEQFGAVEIPRKEYLRRLKEALRVRAEF